MNKQEAIERIESRAFNIEDTDLVVGLSFTKNIINQINEQQKPVVPKFVAEWIEDHKGYVSKWDEEARADFVFMAINDLFRLGEGIKPLDFTIDEKVSEWMTENTYKFITAILFGYTIEQEKLYTVEIPNPNGVVVCLERLDGGKIALSTLGESRLTESEIKKNFEWAWQWAKEVEE